MKNGILMALAFSYSLAACADAPKNKVGEGHQQPRKIASSSSLEGACVITTDFTEIKCLSHRGACAKTGRISANVNAVLFVLAENDSDVIVQLWTRERANTVIGTVSKKFVVADPAQDCGY